MTISSPPHTTMVDSSTSITPSRLHNSPIKKIMRAAHKRKITSLRRQLYNNRQQLVQYKKKIETFDTILRSLKKKNLLSFEDLDIIENFSEWNKSLLNRQICTTKKLKVPRLYDPELRRFALTLHYYSPRGYNYVREKFNKCLPQAKTLSKWYTSINCEPGINFESLTLIKQRVQNSTYQLVGALMFDKMAIR